VRLTRSRTDSSGSRPDATHSKASESAGEAGGAARKAETPAEAGGPGQRMILPLALAQFIASYAATNMNVAISAIAKDLGTTVIGVQTAITVFTLTMASLMIPGSKLSDIWGRKRCFVAGLGIYGTGALLAAAAPALGLMIFGTRCSKAWDRH